MSIVHLRPCYSRPFGEHSTSQYQIFYHSTSRNHSNKQNPNQPQSCASPKSNTTVNTGLKKANLAPHTAISVGELRKRNENRASGVAFSSLPNQRAQPSQARNPSFETASLARGRLGMRRGRREGSNLHSSSGTCK